MDLRVLFLGDIVGPAGKRLVEARLGELREHLRADLVVANAENTANGSGITRALARDIYKAGADLLTLGDHAYAKRDALSYIDSEQRMVRPYNYPEQAVGRGLTFIDLACGRTVALFQLQGRVFLQPTDCPFAAADKAVMRARARTSFVLCDVHAEATSEKVALGWFLDGRVSAVIGTHTHVPTADARVLPGGTAYITDVGMSGPYDSVIGREKQPVIRKFITNVPSFYGVAQGDVRLSGALVVLDGTNGRARSIARVELGEEDPLEEAVHVR